MSWETGLPQERWEKAEQFTFFREIYQRVKFSSFTWNPPNVPATSTVDTTLTVTDAASLKGLRVGQPVHVSPPSTLDSGLAVGGAWVATDDTITIRLANVTAGAINPASGTWAYSGVML